MTAKTLLLTSAILSLMALGARAETELTVYTAFEAELLERYAAAFNKDHPDIKINWVRDSQSMDANASRVATSSGAGLHPATNLALRDRWPRGSIG